jgi:8-oxo-dGTP pyrophosphatase MutT (NUDIX family)
MTETHLHATISLRGVLFTASDDVLLLKRTTDGEWELPGGRLNAGEDALTGLRRELDEETGLDPEVDRPVHTTAWQNDEDSGRFAAYYRCYAARRAVELSGEHTDHAWLSPPRARERLSDTQRRALERAMAGRETAPTAETRAEGAAGATE